jgi:diadenosine tetraphosphate (Ap4A) HIT family hydrolase
LLGLGLEGIRLSDCPLCHEDGGVLIHRDALLRVVRVTDTPAHPVFYRLILQAHLAEFSEMVKAERLLLMERVVLIEQLVLAHAQPTKINLASLGNMVPHLHWHLIARFSDDAQFPAPIWAPALRQTPAEPMQARVALLPALDAALRQALAG